METKLPPEAADTHGSVEVVKRMNPNIATVEYAVLYKTA